MPTKPPQKTQEQKQAERRDELDAIRQMQANRDAEQVEWQREHNEFAARAQAHHDRIASYIRRSWAQRSDEPLSAGEFYRAQGEIQEAAFEQAKTEGSIPSLDGIYQAKAAEERAAEEAAEAARIASITPRQVWMSTLSFSEREHIGKWESINKMPYPDGPKA